MFVNNQHDIKRRGQDFWQKVYIWRGTQWRGWQTNLLRKAGQSMVLISCSKSCGGTGTVDRRPGNGRPRSTRTEENAKLLQKFPQSATDFVLSIVRWSDQEHLFVRKEDKVSGRLQELLKQKLGALHASSAVRVCQLLCTAHLETFRCKSLQIIWDTDGRWIPSPVISHGQSCGSAACPLETGTKSLTVSTFSSVRAQIDGKSK